VKPYSIPFQEYTYICQSFPHPKPEEQDSFDQLVCNLVMAGVSTVLKFSRDRIFVFTWTKPQRA
jgi:hypothetical protein